MYLCYKRPAAPNFSGWQQSAIPLGNGSIGAKVFGGITYEMIQFNEKTLFSGDSEKIGSFQNFGEIFINFNEKIPTSENTYLRDLDLETGSSMMACQKGVNGHNRHYFISAADNIFVGKIEATGEIMLDFTLSLQSEQNGKITYDGAYAYMKGTVNANPGIGKESGSDKNSLEYLCCVKVISDDGEITSSDEGITVKNTFTATIIMSCATAYSGKDDLDKCVENVESASQKTFAQLFKRHLDDYKNIMGRTKLNFGQNDENITTDVQLRMYSKGKYKADIEALLFEMGKYVLYASSRNGVLPMLSCGIWNSVNVHDDGPILIDTEKAEQAYKTAKMLNMSEVCSPFDAFTRDRKGKKLFNPFGAETERKIEAPKKTSSFSKFFKKEKAPLSASSALNKISECGNNAKKAYALLESAVSFAHDNLLFSDAFENIAFTEAVTKMLLKEDDDGTVMLLPCLPEDRSMGSISGICLAGMEISFEWADGHFKKGSILAQRDGICKLCANGKFIGVSDENGNDVNEVFENGIISFEVQNGKKYELY